jgi:hypothetical protein
MFDFLSLCLKKNTEAGRRIQNEILQKILQGKLYRLRWYCKEILVFRVPELLYSRMLWVWGTKSYDCTETLIFYILWYSLYVWYLQNVLLMKRMTMNSFAGIVLNESDDFNVVRRKIRPQARDPLKSVTDLDSAQ